RSIRREETSKTSYNMPGSLLILKDSSQNDLEGQVPLDKSDALNIGISKSRKKAS
uniref:Uncharacterized protein n=1 Tax=Steinernema glaseri TaxID=37863 RepID=A0A1I7Z6T4_9BILA